MLRNTVVNDNFIFSMNNEPFFKESKQNKTEMVMNHPALNQICSRVVLLCPNSFIFCCKVDSE